MRRTAASAVKFPYYTYNHDTGGTAAIGGDFYGNPVSPAVPRELLLRRLHRELDQSAHLRRCGNPAGVQPFASNAASPVSLVTGPDGMIYYLSFTTGEIRASATTVWRPTHRRRPTPACHPCR